MSRESLLKALMSQYQGEMDIAMANIDVYQNNPAGIGEHPDVAQALDTQIERYATAKEKYEACYDLIHNKPQTTLTE
jgi:hypothetical protein|tara:strand:+ start:324 stop:554 length:231 start_codon:yes stop_codon:yes gene_type:complete